MVAVCGTLLLSIAAIIVDGGRMYSTRAELQSAADAGALAAASRLVGDGQAPVEDLARAAAALYASKHQADGADASIDTTADVELGRAQYDGSTGKFTFVSSTGNYDAVRVTVRKADGASGGPLGFTFAKIFGASSTDVGATAAAALVPRDIALVIDISSSMRDDSLTEYWDRNDGGYANTRDVWAALDGPQPSRPYEPGSELVTEYASDSGPTYGFMQTWGDPLLPTSYDAAQDPGLWRIKHEQSCTESAASTALASVGYTPDERDALLGDDGDDGDWRGRIGAILGLAVWKSGMPGSVMGGGGNGDDVINSNEIVWGPAPSYAVGWDWEDYVDFVATDDYYDASNLTAFRDRYGLKTFTDFVMKDQKQYSDTNNLWATPQQPLRAIKDAVAVLADTITSQSSFDQISLEGFSYQAFHEVDLTTNVSQIPALLDQRQAAHYGGGTNIGDGIMRGIMSLNSNDARSFAKKVIVVMSDGEPTSDESEGGHGAGGGRDPSAWALAAAQLAADQNITIYSISVGYGADRALMQQIASIGKGIEFYAAGSPQQYTDQLEDIFRTLGGQRPTALIE